MHFVHQKAKNDRTSTIIHPIKHDNTPLGIEVVLRCLSKLYFMITTQADSPMVVTEFGILMVIKELQLKY